MTGFIEVHPRNVFQGLLLVNIDEIQSVYRVSGDRNQVSTVLRLNGADSRPLDVEESYDEIKRLIAQALAPQPSPQGLGFTVSTGALAAVDRQKTGTRQ
jgi:hypothetical protein